MTEDKTTITSNEEIAWFHGWTHVPTPKRKGKGVWNFQAWGKASYDSAFFRYDKDWDWLMPVVEKISRHVYDEEEVDDGFGGKQFVKHTAYLRTFGMLSPEGNMMVRFNRSPLFEADTLIEATYKAVVDWIRWYN